MPLSPYFPGRYISSVDPKGCLPPLWVITFLTSLSSCCRSARLESRPQILHIVGYCIGYCRQCEPVRCQHFIIEGQRDSPDNLTDIPCRKTFAAPISTSWSSCLKFSVTARNLQKDSCFKLCVNSESPIFTPCEFSERHPLYVNPCTLLFLPLQTYIHHSLSLS